jgi:hypothetical protein
MNTDSIIISHVFQKWRAIALEEKKYIPEDSCSYSYLDKNDLNSLVHLAIPNQCNWSWGDLNEDGITDAMITFSPIQCDGGNATMMFQTAVFILSKNDTYYPLEIYPSLSLVHGGHFYRFNSILNGKIKATYIDYKEKDGRCCPSIIIPCTIRVKNNKFFRDRYWLRHLN